MERLWLLDPREAPKAGLGRLRNHTEDRLFAALFIAGIIHAAVILGVTFAKPNYPDTKTSTLDVVLVQQATTSEPKDAAFLAQANQDGGGNTDQALRPSSPLPAPFTGPTAEVVTSAPPPAASEPDEKRAAVDVPSDPQPESRPVLAQTQNALEQVIRRPPKARPRPKSLSKAAQAPVPAPTATPPKPRINAITLVTKSLAYASLNAGLERRIEQYASKPKRKWITARTRESKYAAYMDAWRAKVERIGNLNYPDGARRKRLAGTLLLDVALNSNGSVNEVTLRRSSGHRVLDDAAIRIVKLAAPFAPLPANIRREADILHIERTWQFLSSNRLSSR